MGIAEVRLYSSTTSTIPVGVYEDVTSQFALGPGIDTDTLTETLQASGLTAGRRYWFWIQALDEANNDSGIISLGNRLTSGGGIGAWYGVWPGTSFTASSNTGSLLPDYAFNNAVGATFTDNNTYSWRPTVGIPAWIAVELPESMRVNSYRIWAHTNTNGNYDMPDEWVLQGSSDGSVWTDIDTRPGGSHPPVNGVTGLPEDAPHGSYTVATPGNYRHYRMFVTNCYAPNRANNNRLAISEIALEF